MNNWKVNLAVLWFGQFLVMSGMTMIMPFLPFYLQEMGMHDPNELALWVGLIFASNFVTSFLFQPMWGGLGDRYGRKIMLLRSGFGMAIVVTLMGFATSAWHLLLLRMLNGVISGFQPAAISLQSANTPREKIGYAMGTLQSGATAGTILGPLMGGLLAEWIDFRLIFYITGGLLFVATMLALLFVKENFAQSAAKALPRISLIEGIRQLSVIRQLPAIFAVTFLLQFAMLGPMPQMPLFVQQLMNGQTANLVFFSGLVSSANGFSSIFASPLLGRLSDRIGPHKVLVVSMIGTAAMLVPHAFVQNIWQLFACRFALGIFMGGLLPSVYALIRLYTPEGMESRAYSLNTSTLSLGNMLGPTIGGILVGLFSIRGLFIMSAILLIVNVFWVRKTLFGSSRPAKG